MCAGNGRTVGGCDTINYCNKTSNKTIMSVCFIEAKLYICWIAIVLQRRLADVQNPGLRLDIVQMRLRNSSVFLGR